MARKKNAVNAVASPTTSGGGRTPAGFVGNLISWIVSNALTLGFGLRVVLLTYGWIQDLFFDVRYTDIDYKVYTDAAKYVLEGGSPYSRHTYRYTPLLAYLMTPNVFLFGDFGKVLFSFVDILCGMCIRDLLRKTCNTLSEREINVLVSVWIFNPLVANVSTRGNADTIISLMVIETLRLLLHRRITLAALLFGLVVHFKIYPILYALPFYFYIDHNAKDRGFFTINRVKFTLISASVFLVLLAVFYKIYGWDFLFETYLYHIGRKDNRHNFSVYFYTIYLNYHNISSLMSVLTFLPQLLVLTTTGYKFYKDLPLCVFIQTFAFVVFNKVCTAQYFIWYMVYIPLVLANNRLYTKEGRSKYLWMMLALWLGTELLWNVAAYFMEFQSFNTFIHIWLASLLFFIINIFILHRFIVNQKVTPFMLKYVS